MFDFDVGCFETTPDPRVGCPCLSFLTTPGLVGPSFGGKKIKHLAGSARWGGDGELPLPSPHHSMSQLMEVDKGGEAPVSC